MGNSITIELCAEDRARLDALNSALAEISGKLDKRCEACAEDALKIFNIGEPVAVAVTPPEAEKGEKAAEPQTTPPAAEKPVSAPQAAPTTTYTHDDLRAEFIRLSNAGHRDQAKALIQSYAAAIKDVPADKLGEVMARLKEVG